jgi:hypothetical protein
VSSIEGDAACREGNAALFIIVVAVVVVIGMTRGGFQVCFLFHNSVSCFLSSFKWIPNRSMGSIVTLMSARERRRA